MQTLETRPTRLAGQKTRTALIERADAMMRTQGYSGFSFGQLSDALGVGKASIHHHFPTKEDLALEVMRFTRDKFAELFERLEGESERSDDRVRGYADAYLGCAAKGHGCVFTALMAERSALTPRLRESAEEAVEQHLTWLSYVIDLGQKSRQIRTDLDPDEAAALVMSTLEGALMLELAAGGASHSQMRETVGLMMTMLRPVNG